MKKFLVSFSFLLLVFMLMPLSAECAGKLQYEIMPDGNARIVGGDVTGDVVIPSRIGVYKVTSIGAKAFYGKTGIISIRIPKTVTDIGQSDYCFSYCYDLERIIVDKQNPVFSSRDGVLFDKSKKVLYCFPCNKNVRSYHVPRSVKFLCNTSFASVKKLTDIYIDNRDAIWEEYTFWNYFNHGDLKVYYLPGGDSECTAVDCMRNGQAYGSIRQWPTYKLWLRRPTIKSLKNNASRSVTVVFSTVTGARGYQVFYSIDSKFTRYNTKVMQCKGTSCTIKDMLKGKKYYIRVRAYQRDYRNKLVYGNFSDVKTIKVRQ